METDWKKFEETVYTGLAEMPIDAVRRIGKKVRKTLKQRAMDRRVNKLDADGVQRMEKLVHQRKRVLMEQEQKGRAA